MENTSEKFLPKISKDFYHEAKGHLGQLELTPTAEENSLEGGKRSEGRAFIALNYNNKK